MGLNRGGGNEDRRVRLKASGKGGEWSKTAAEAVELQLGSQRGRCSESEGSRPRLEEGCLGWCLDGSTENRLRLRRGGCLGWSLNKSTCVDFRLFYLLILDTRLG